MMLRRFATALMALSLILVGCPDDSAPGETVDVGPGSDPGGNGTGNEVVVSEDPGTTTGSEETSTTGPDEGEDIVEQENPYFGDPCSNNDDCVDPAGDFEPGWCVQNPDTGEFFCSETCVDECPDGYGCVAIQNAGSDGLLVCMPETSTNCNECEEDSDCIYSGAKCMQVGANGGVPDMRCAMDCGDSAAICGSDYECVKTELDDGSEADLCIPTTKSCVCFGLGEDGNPVNGSSRQCSVAVEGLGTCLGTEVCDGENGWAGCTAENPVAEICDGKDNDCSGVADNGLTGEACSIENEHGICAGTESCEGEAGWVCADAEGAAIVPAAAEVCDGADNNCDGNVDEGTPDNDKDGTCDELDTDDDDDLVPDETDNCKFKANPDQKDTNNNGVGDACDDDADSDGVLNADDNCPTVPNTNQSDIDKDTLGDVCDDDADGDGQLPPIDCDDFNAAKGNGFDEICDGIDNNCNELIDEGFKDSDGDQAADCIDLDDDNDDFPDVCPEGDEQCVADCNPTNADVNPDAEEICDGLDNNCADGIDEGFADLDEDEIADCVDDDKDNDNVKNADDNCELVFNPDQQNQDNDAIGDACDTDDDNDGVLDDEDNCQFVANNDQKDFDGDTLGDVCDADADNDGHDAGPGSDCNDLDKDIFFGAQETCDGKDNDCNDKIDEGSDDTDNDGLADCVDPDDDQDGDADEFDCAPLDKTINSSANEECDGIDNNCNLDIDEGCPPTSVDIIFTSAVVTGELQDGTQVLMSVGLDGPVGESKPENGEGFSVFWGFYHTLP